MASEPESYRIGDRDLPLWPDDADFHNVEKGVFRTTFSDAPLIKSALVDKAMEVLAELGDEAESDAGAAGGPKLHHLERWNIPEVDLLLARVREMFKRLLKSDTAAIDLSWCNLYRPGDFIMPHSHARATGAMVYMLDEGDQNDDDPMAGRLCFTDPRFEKACNQRAGFLSSPLFPQMPEGTLIMFPAQAVHMVTPYHGTRPRVTFAFNVNAVALQGHASDGRVGIPE